MGNSGGRNARSGAHMELDEGLEFVESSVKVGKDRFL